MNNLEALPMSFLVSYIFILGLCVGSFLNVVVLRGLSGESIVFGRSHCPKCLKQLKWYMNIPLFSYIFLRGKCAYCKTKISFQYPIVEAITGMFFVLIFLFFGLTLKTLFLWVIFSLFIVMSVTDILETVILDIHAYFLLFVSLIYSISGVNNISISQALIGAFVGYLVFEILARAGKIFTGCRMFGEGDSLIALGIGAIFGYKAIFLIIALSILIQTFCSIPFLIYSCLKNNKKSLAISYVFVLVSIVILILLNIYQIDNYPKIYLSIVSILVLFLLWSLKNILFEIKQKTQDDSQIVEQKFHLMPFGPALIISSVICIFYLNQIKDFVVHFIN